MENVDKISLEEAQAYMCNIPKTYAESLELDKGIFFEIMGHLCDLEWEKDKKDKKNKRKGTQNFYSPTHVPIQFETPTYMVLDFDTVKKYCSQGFPPKYVRSHVKQYKRTVSAAILIYYEILKNNKHVFDRNEYDKLFGWTFLEESIREKLYTHDIEDVISRFDKGKIQKFLDTHLLRAFSENWCKRGKILDMIEASRRIIHSDFCNGYEEELCKLCDRGGIFTHTIKFLNKLETDSHAKCSDGVLIPYKEYHALQEMLSEYPSLKGTLREKRDEIFTDVINLRRIH